VLQLDELLAPAGWAYASDGGGRFQTLFGRDSLITALQLLPVRADVARATLTVLADLQGQADDAETDEEPGKILHEHWSRAPQELRDMNWPVRGDELRYYGSADSTPWFLVLAASLDDPGFVAGLEPAWRAAGEWLERALERGGGLLRHGPRTWPGGLKQQGWRDTTDPLDPDTTGGGIVREDGGAPVSPLADADTQAVALAGMRALTRLSGDDRHRIAADQLRSEIEARFGPETMAIEADGREVRGAGSQLGWLLWAGARPPGAAERLVEPDVLTDFGLRTLSDAHPQFQADGYHRGSVWPFDSWIGWGGLRAAGLADEAERVRTGVLDALVRLGGSPELYAVGPRGPEPVPIANRVQAWTVGARWAFENDWDGRSVVA
jgi:glycogen debranching enzyme